MRRRKLRMAIALLRQPLRRRKLRPACLAEQERVYPVRGGPPSLRMRRCSMETFLLDVLAGILAGVVTDWIVKRFNS